MRRVQAELSAYARPAEETKQNAQAEEAERTAQAEEARQTQQALQTQQLQQVQEEEHKRLWPVVVTGTAGIADATDTAGRGKGQQPPYRPRQNPLHRGLHQPRGYLYKTVDPKRTTATTRTALTMTPTTYILYSTTQQ